jgi:hypothetical protein
MIARTGRLLTRLALERFRGLLGRNFADDRSWRPPRHWGDANVICTELQNGGALVTQAKVVATKVAPPPER